MDQTKRQAARPKPLSPTFAFPIPSHLSLRASVASRLAVPSRLNPSGPFRGKAFAKTVPSRPSRPLAFLQSKKDLRSPFFPTPDLLYP